MENRNMTMQAQAFYNANSLLRRVVQHVERVIVGQRAAIDLAVITLAARGHLLIEDVPGTGKTMMARTLARSVGCSFKRIQLTPDLLPADITGGAVFNPRDVSFEFRAGPINAQIVLADELNRATPRTQSALLEAMEEHQVTVDGTSHALPTPFMVVATQNPIEYEGTFTLPEAQLDRFMMRISLGYPAQADELTILRSHRDHSPLDVLTPISDAQEILAVQQLVPLIYVDPAIDEYVVRIGASTRQHDDIVLGTSTRALLSLIRSAQARALLAGRDYVLPDDIKYLAAPVCAHRIMVSNTARMRNVSAVTIINEIVNTIPAPNHRSVERRSAER